MSNSYSQIRQRYQAMTDEQLIKIANYELSELSPMGLEILKEELQHRGLGLNMAEARRLQEEGLQPEEIEELIEYIQQAPCPRCGQTKHLLQSRLLVEVVSLLVITNRNKEMVIACPPCLEKATNKAVYRTLLLGWWGIPMGIIRTFQEMVRYGRVQADWEGHSRNGLQTFVKQHATFLSVNKHKPEAISALLKSNHPQ